VSDVLGDASCACPLVSWLVSAMSSVFTLLFLLSSLLLPSALRSDVCSDLRSDLVVLWACRRSAQEANASQRHVAAVDGLVHDAVRLLEHAEKTDKVAAQREARRQASSVYPFKAMGSNATPKGPYLGARHVP
jgi:hypothetical protein